MRVFFFFCGPFSNCRYSENSLPGGACDEGLGFRVCLSLVWDLKCPDFGVLLAVPALLS